MSFDFRPHLLNSSVNVVRSSLRKMSAATTYTDFDPKNMPFRRLGPSGLRVPLFSLGGCKFEILERGLRHRLKIPIGLTLGGTVVGDPVKASETALTFLDCSF